jgi:hypothetical protein
MSRRVTRKLTGATVAALVILSPAPALAGPGSGGGGGSGGSVDGVLTAHVTYQTGGGSGGDGCSWERIDGELGVPSMGSAKFPFVDENGVTQILWRRICPGGAVDWFLIPQTTPADILPQLLEELKERALPIPAPTFEMLDPVNNWAYVTVPVDFRAGANSWRTVAVTASIGPVWATVTAQPVLMTFDPGDPNGPGGVSCNGSGPVAAYVAETPGACSYTYTNASSTSPYDGYHFLTTTTIDWSISWTSSSGAGGTLAPYSTSASAPLAVAEVKGLVTCTGSRAEQGGC